MEQFHLIIDGRKVSTASTFDVINPATEAVLAQAPDCSHEQLDFAIESARRAFSTWKKDEAARRHALTACANLLRSNARDLGGLLTQEQGKTLQQAEGEFGWAAWWIEEVLSMEISAEVVLDNEHERAELHRRPLGVIGAIMPWNYPIILSIAKIAPALLMGNTMVLKPSPYTPLSSLRMGELFASVLPPGVLNVVSGGDELGAWMTRHPGIQKVTFTGSVATGKKVAQSTASNLSRITLELGGNDAAIVLADIDPKQVVAAIFEGAFSQNGQACIAIKRLYVHEDIHDEMVVELSRLAEKTKLGDGLEPEVEMGPINNLEQLERVIELTEDARNSGAVIVTGGKRLERPGYFFPPTIVTQIRDGARLVDEEQFGPVLPIIPFADVDEVIKRANDSEFGLGGSVWTNDTAKGAELAARLECGSAGVNQHTGFDPRIPFGGAKQSGVGIQNGFPGLDDLSQLQVVTVRK
ncbi:MAG: aldehyde dehydrogenase [Anaerolineae bacterium SG8_19]|nr:MAG: aldehyde dehydrogenase [Anaerolineae bacterium SG8_19]